MPKPASACGTYLSRFLAALKKYVKFVGPGLMVSVAYMDPGNYSTAVAAGSAHQYKLLFSILLSNCLAVFLQVLAAKLGAVTGLDLAANCRKNLPRHLNLFIYVLTEIAIIATDLAEVVGTAIALNILFKIPLVAGVLLTVVDVVVVLMAYRPNGPLLFVRLFELFVSLLVAATVVCFAIEFYQVAREPEFSFSLVLRGFLPNKSVLDMENNGLYLSLAILGATVMPHSLYLGSGLVQTRLKDYDVKHGYYVCNQKSARPRNLQEQFLVNGAHGSDVGLDLASSNHNPNDNNLHGPGPLGHTIHENNTPKPPDKEKPYRPSIHAIKDTMTYTIVELVTSLFTVALFVNATILIVAGTMMGHSSLGDTIHEESDADLFTIYHYLSAHLSPTAGTVFALALLCSGQSAGVVCTLAGQIVLEGFLNWSFPPAVRRLITRALAIMPCLFVVVFLDKDGLAKTLNALQVVLSVLLPVVTAPLIWFTCSKRIMSVPVQLYEEDLETRVAFADLDLETQRSLHDEGTSKSYAEPAIMLRELSMVHTSSNMEDQDKDTPELELLEHMKPWPDSEVESPTLLGERRELEPIDEDSLRLGHLDMSNGPVTTFFSIFVWVFVTCLNLYLVVSVS